MKTNSEIALQNIDDFLLSLLPNEVSFEVDYESSTVTNKCRFSIELNNKIVVDKKIINETATLGFKSPKESQIKLNLKMFGKDPYDTIVENNQIVKDTYIKFNKIVINGYNILSRYDFLRKYVIYTNEENVACDFKSGFWSDGCISLTFDWPFEFYFNDKTKNNDQFSMANLTDQSIESLKNELTISLQNLKY